MYYKIPGNMKKGWLNENIVAIMAIVTMVFCIVVLLIILVRPVKATDTNTTIILTGTFNVMMLVLGYYFVSSKSSKDKDKQIADLTGKQEEGK